PKKSRPIIHVNDDGDRRENLRFPVLCGTDESGFRFGEAIELAGRAQRDAQAGLSCFPQQTGFGASGVDDSQFVSRASWLRMQQFSGRSFLTNTLTVLFADNVATAFRFGNEFSLLLRRRARRRQERV